MSEGDVGSRGLSGYSCCLLLFMMVIMVRLVLSCCNIGDFVVFVMGDGDFGVSVVVIDGCAVVVVMVNDGCVVVVVVIAE